MPSYLLFKYIGKKIQKPFSQDVLYVLETWETHTHTHTSIFVYIFPCKPIIPPAASVLSIPARIFPIYFPMGNMATGFFVIFSLLAGVVGIATSITGITNTIQWNTSHLYSAAASSLITWSLTLLAMGWTIFPIFYFYNYFLFTLKFTRHDLAGSCSFSLVILFPADLLVRRFIEVGQTQNW